MVSIRQVNLFIRHALFTHQHVIKYNKYISICEVRTFSAYSDKKYTIG